MRKSNFLPTLALVFIAFHYSHADDKQRLDAVRWDQKQGAKVPGDLQFRDEQGGVLRLGDAVAAGKPTVLALVYYGCPNLCTLTLNGLVKTLEELKNDPEFEVGKDFNVLSVSIDPTERPRLALAKQRSYLARLNLNPATHTELWKFLTVDAQQPDGARLLSDAVGYHYTYDEISHQYSHPSGLVVLDGEGRVTQYLMGIQFSPADLSRALELAKNGRRGNPIKEFLLACAHYDPFSEKSSRRVLIGIQLFTAAFLGVAAWAALKLRVSS